MNDLLKEKLSLLPDLPGCYLMKDLEGIIIYVGKAKRLKNRVRSYFTGSHNNKTESLVAEIADFEYVVTSSNKEALLLEINLIKKYRPKYNMLLKDDKNYPYIKITAERHPRLIITRSLVQDGGIYFGPYPFVQAAKDTTKLLERLYPLRRCHVSENRPCLYYQLGLCIGSCDHEVSPEEYKERIRQIRHFLNGGYLNIKQELQRKMNQASENMDFEKAKEYHDLINSIEITMEKQKIVISEQRSMDVFGFATDREWMAVETFFIRSGKLQAHDFHLFPIMNHPNEEIFHFLIEYYNQNERILPKEILLQTESDIEELAKLLNTTVLQPKRGKKKGLINLAVKNAALALKEKLALME
ncbi:excinuclease ABC subunit UvrC, partial [Bacillus andreraoultii]|uniref:excinuclease ABC subunit UvrC n=1 Tax=Bacillus andreraoultii TaxID=1499685 RepID=UPI00053BA92A